MEAAGSRVPPALSRTDPPECRSASAAFRARVEALLERVQAAPLRGAAEAELLASLGEATSAAAEVERAWRVALARALLERRDAAAACMALTQRLEGEGAERAAQARQLEALRAVAEAARAERDEARREGAARAARAEGARSEEVESWKRDYVAEMGSFVARKLGEARRAAREEHGALLAAALARVEAEYAARAAAAAAAQQEAARRAAEAEREAEAMRRRAAQALAQAQALAAELAAQRARADAAERAGEDASAAALGASGEAARLGRALQLERRAHGEAARVQAARADAALESGGARAEAALAAREAEHGAELQRLRRAFDLDARARDEALAAWRARAETAEALLRDLDAGLVEAGGGEAAAR